MLLVDPAASILLLIDVQERLMPAIADGAAALANARRLAAAARLLGVPLLLTEQNPRGLGPTVPGLVPDPPPALAKATFDAGRSPEVRDRLRPGLVPVVAGCEAHVCVLQTVLVLLGAGRRAVVVADAVGSRREASREAALARMERHGAEVVTAEMAIVEWLASSDHPRSREALALLR